jgi:hypothetical protein
MMALVFIAFYIPTHHVRLPIFWPLLTVAVLIYPWLRQLFATWALWKQIERAEEVREEFIADEKGDS